MCVSTFLFLRRGPKILLGKYADDPRWEDLAGLDEAWRGRHRHGWTIPARQLKFGEDPRDAARHVGETILQLPGLRYGEPRAEVDLYESQRAAGHLHYDLWFLVDASLPKGVEVAKPPWYAAIEWKDPRTTARSEFARGHEDVVARWLARRRRT
jgi:ADP-ribose pyrophosphatase YjhB (NUDIX family)